MNAKNLILGLSVAAIGLSSCNNSTTKTNVSLKSEADTASFYIGYLYGSNITVTELKTLTWTLSSPE